MRDAEVVAILGRVAEGEEAPKLMISFEVGEKVKVNDGPFEDFDGMVERGELELNPDRKEALLIELVTAGSDARSVKHMLKKLTSTLVDSEHVEEIYPSDDKIQDRLKADLGG